MYDVVIMIGVDDDDCDDDDDDDNDDDHDDDDDGDDDDPICSYNCYMLCLCFPFDSYFGPIHGGQRTEDSELKTTQ